MLSCPFCRGHVPTPRFLAGYTYCTDTNCVAQGLRTRRDGYRLVLMPKQGFTYVSVNDPNLKTIGRSSGRS